MTARMLQQDLKKEIESLLEHKMFQSPDGTEKKVSVFEQFIPAMQNEDDTDPFPYVIVRLESGTIPDIDKMQETVVTLLLGVYDDSGYRGHDAIMEMMQAIANRFCDDNILAKRYELQHPIEWAMQDEESYPYYFGAMSLTFTSRTIARRLYE